MIKQKDELFIYALRNGIQHRSDTHRSVYSNLSLIDDTSRQHVYVHIGAIINESGERQIKNNVGKERDKLIGGIKFQRVRRGRRRRGIDRDRNLDPGIAK